MEKRKCSKCTWFLRSDERDVCDVCRALNAIYQRYGNNLQTFFDDVKKRHQKRKVNKLQNEIDAVRKVTKNEVECIIPHKAEYKCEYCERKRKESQEWVEEMQKEIDAKIEANRESERITGEDLNLIVY